MKRTTLALAALLAVDTALADFDPQSALPDIGNSSQATLTTADEQRLGDSIIRQIRRSGELVDDPELEDYMNSLGLRLSSNLPEQPFRYHFYISLSPAINAFALPGGHIVIYSGLILATQSENELASVVAHEIAHVSQRHYNRGMEAQPKMSIPMIAGLMAAMVLASMQNKQLGSQDAGMAAMMAGMAGSTQARINFTRAHEAEADRVGIQLLADSRMDPRGMASFFNRLFAATRYSEFAVPEILRDHPVTLNRIAESQSRAEKLPIYNQADTFGYLLTRSKLATMSTTNLPAVKQQLENRLSNVEPPAQHATRYALAYANFQTNNYAEAQKHVEFLLAHDERRVPYLRLKSDILFAAGQQEQAMSLYQQALQLHPYNKSLTVGYADALLQRKQAAAAKELLDDYLRGHPISAGVLELKARAEEALGNDIELHATLAEYYDQLGQTRDAIKHLETALAKAQDNPYRAPKLQQRLDQLKQQALQEKAGK